MKMISTFVQSMYPQTVISLTGSRPSISRHRFVLSTSPNRTPPNSTRASGAQRAQQMHMWGV